MNIGAIRFGQTKPKPKEKTPSQSQSPVKLEPGRVIVKDFGNGIVLTKGDPHNSKGG